MEPTPGVTGWLEVSVGGKLVHSKKVRDLSKLTAKQGPYIHGHCTNASMFYKNV